MKLCVLLAPLFIFLVGSPANVSAQVSGDDGDDGVGGSGASGGAGGQGGQGGSGGGCPRGFALRGGLCTCIRKCPLNAEERSGVTCPVSFRRDCLCKSGYRIRGTKCVRKNRFNPVLPPFGPSVTNPYESCRDLRRGITLALQSLADTTMDDELQKSFCRSGGVGAGGSGGNGGTGGNGGDAEIAADGGEGGAAGEDSFETNNQVEGVDEADVVKSDGEFIFAAYGTELVMMNLEGDIIDRVVCSLDGSDEGVNVRSLLLDPDSQTITALGFDYSGRKRETIAHIYSYTATSLKPVRNIFMPGRYEDARSIDAKAHVITSVSIETFTVRNALRRCNTMYRNLSDQEYEEAAFKEAKKTIRKVVVEILNDLGIDRRAEDSKCKNIVKISSMTDADSDSTETEEDSELDVTGGGGLLRNFICITSFDMDSSNSEIETAGVFVPTFDTEVFASNEFIVIAGRGYRRINLGGATNVWSEYTFLTSFEFQDNNCKVIPAAVGSVRGYLLNQFSMDFYDGFLRVATTSFQRWGYVNGRWQRVSESSSQVSKLRFDGGRIILVGELTGLGTTETIFSVRFVRNRGYVVTFLQIDPLFVIDMDPNTPALLGELKITGFSNFLQPIGDNDQYLLGIGQEANPTNGRPIGLKISLFDVSDPSDPQEIQSHVVEGSSSSEAQFESKAFRYLPISKKLILPVRVFSRGASDDFDGFVVFNVDVDAGIEPAGEVTHGDNDSINDFDSFYCYSSAVLEPRSLVFSGNLVTFKGHTVEYSKGLDALEPGWTVNLDEDRDRSADECYFYFFDFGFVEG